MAKDDPISPLVLDEYFASGDDRFLPTLRNFHEPRKLASLTDRWKKDFRPWARKQVFTYLDEPLDVPGHETVVKRLFKHAEEQNDDELMAAFAVAFDRLVRRVRRTRHRYDWQTRASWSEERLFSPRNALPPVGKPPEVKKRQTRRVKPESAGKWRGKGLLFSYHTRYYLRRRAWRYFRRKGFRKPKEYPAAVALMLRRYTDEMLASGENLLDSWALAHACFRGSDVLDFGPSKVNVRDGRSLSELQAAPEFPELWNAPAATGVLVTLLSTAPARPVRVWSIQLLRRDHMDRLGDVSADQVLALLDHDDDEVQQFAAEVLERSTSLGTFDLATWLKLLQTRNITALETIARLMTRHVRADQLTLEQTVELANAAPVPVARLGLRFLQSRRVDSVGERAVIARLAHARSAGITGEIATWALSILGAPEHYDVDFVSPFFDGLLQPARDAAWTWLVGAAPALTQDGTDAVGATPASPSSAGNPGDAGVAPTSVSAGYHDPALWSRLIETPYDDLRFHVIDELKRRVTLPGTRVEQVALVWTSVLLNIHRGGRPKLAALKQISRAVADDPAHAEPLLPVLAVAIRSVRMPEVRTGLSALVAAVEKHPPLGVAVARVFPELELSAEAAV